MPTIVEKPTATCTINGVSAFISQGTVTLDKEWAPYGQARITVPITDPSDVEDIDPRSLIRCVINASNPSTIGDTARTFNLGVRSRRASHQDMTVELELATDEAILQDWAPLVDDEGPLALQGSLRAVVNYVLAKAGLAALEAGADVDATRYWNVTNLVTNPSGEVDVDGWAMGSNAGGLDDITMSSPAAPHGSKAIGYASLAAGESNIQPLPTPTETRTYPVRPGEWYVWRFDAASSIAAGRNVRAAIQWWSADGTVLSSTSVGANALATSTAFGVRTLVAMAPEGASHALPFVNATASAGGEIFYIDRAMFYAGKIIVPVFLGDTPADANYTYAWARVAHDSTTTRTALKEAPVEALIWPAGTSAWEFIQPVVLAYGKRLFCDEARKWRLVDSDYTVPGMVSVTEQYNATAGEDLITRNDENLWADGVVVVYKPSGGIVRYDIAGTAGKVRRVEYERPYPGPGAATFILDEMKGRGRTQEVTALTDYTATPNQAVNIDMPGTIAQVGLCRSVSWQLHTGLMRVGSRELTSAPSSAWVKLASGQSWNASPVGGTWVGESV